MGSRFIARVTPVYLTLKLSDSHAKAGVPNYVGITFNIDTTSAPRKKRGSNAGVTWERVDDRRHAERLSCRHWCTPLGRRVAILRPKLPRDVHWM